MMFWAYYVYIDIFADNIGAEYVYLDMFADDVRGQNMLRPQSLETDFVD